MSSYSSGHITWRWNSRYWCPGLQSRNLQLSFVSRRKDSLTSSISLQWPSSSSSMHISNADGTPGHKWYIEEQWRARLLWHFPLPPEQVQSSNFFTNDILRLETETLSQLMFRFELQQCSKDVMCVWVWVSSRACSARTLINLSPSCNRWQTFELAKKVFGGDLCVSLGCIWRLIVVVGNEFMCISGLFLKTDCSGW